MSVRASPTRTLKPPHRSGPRGPNVYCHPTWSCIRWMAIHVRTGPDVLFPQTWGGGGLCRRPDRCHACIRQPWPTQNPLPRPRTFPPEAVSAAPERQRRIHAGPERTRPLTGAGIEAARRPREPPAPLPDARTFSPCSNNSLGHPPPLINHVRLPKNLLRRHPFVRLPATINHLAA